MARPRIVKLNDGEVSLSGFSKEVADALSEHIKAFGKEQVIIPDGESPSQLPELLEIDPPTDDFSPFTPPSLDDLPGRAIGIYKHNNQRKLVTVAYNLDTKAALVEKEEVCTDVREASVKFKMAADKNKFV